MDERFLTAAVVTLVVAVVYAALLKGGQRFLTKSAAPDTAAEPTSARRFYTVGQVFGLLYIAAAIVTQIVGATDEGTSLKLDVLWASVFALLGFVLYVLAGQLGVRLLLGRRLRAEIDEGNEAAGIAAGAHHVAVALIVGESAIGGAARDVLLSLTFFGLGILAHQVIVALFRVVTKYDDAEQIAGDNVAAAVSYAGVSLAVALVVARGLDGDFTTWSTSLWGFAQVCLLALVLYPVRQLLVEGMLLGKRPRLRGGALDEAVGTRHDVSLAALEAVSLLATAIAVVRLL